MAVVAHTFVSAKADGTDASLIKPSDWNANHSIAMAAAGLVGRSTAGPGVVEDIAVSGALDLTAGVLNCTALTFNQAQRLIAIGGV